MYYSIYNVGFDFLYKFCLKHSSFYEELSNIRSKMYIGLHVKYRYFCQILIKLEFFRHRFEKYKNVKFHENPHSGSRVFPCGRTDGRTDRQTNMTKLMSLFDFCERS